MMNVNSLSRSATIEGAGSWRMRRGRVSGAGRAWVHLLLVASDTCPRISLASWADDP